MPIREGKMIGPTTWRKVCHGVAPRSRAASSSRLSKRLKIANMINSPNGQRPRQMRAEAGCEKSHGRRVGSSLSHVRSIGFHGVVDKAKLERDAERRHDGGNDEARDGDVEQNRLAEKLLAVGEAGKDRNDDRRGTSRSGPRIDRAPERAADVDDAAACQQVREPVQREAVAAERSGRPPGPGTTGRRSRSSGRRETGHRR